jgi:hypothetical protein
MIKVESTVINRLMFFGMLRSILVVVMKLVRKVQVKSTATYKETAPFSHVLCLHTDTQ